MAELSVQQVTLDGVSPSFVAADVAGDNFINNGRTILHVKNDDTVSKTVTIDSVQPCNHGFDHDIVISIPAGEERKIGTFDKNRFNDSSYKVNVTYDSVTSVTVAAVTY